MQTAHHLARMRGEPDALDILADRAELLIVIMGDKRDAATIARREAREKDTEARHKDAEADKVRAAINRISAVRARILKARGA